MGNYVGASVSVSAELSLIMSIKHFWRMNNKPALINHVAEYMVNVDITFQHAVCDSDYKISTVACMSTLAKPRGFIADNTDMFQLLIHHADLSDYYENMPRLHQDRQCASSH